jgi:hypothetical protein
MTIPTTIIALATMWLLVQVAIQLVDVIDAFKIEVRDNKTCRYCQAAYSRGQKQTHMRMVCPRASEYYADKVRFVLDHDPNALVALANN